MSEHHASSAATLPDAPLAAGLTVDALLTLCQQRFGATRDPLDRWDLTVIVPASSIRSVLQALRDDPALRFDQLLDVVGIDYLAFPGHRGPRFAVTYVLKSTASKHRLKIKVQVDEDRPEVPSVHDLYKIADWSERETWDQYGIVFTGHPNLKRLLNHHEFVGHPLRKDYPCQKRQKLSTNDPMLDQLESRLRQRGYQVLEQVSPSLGAPIAGASLESGAKP